MGTIKTFLKNNWPLLAGGAALAAVVAMNWRNSAQQLSAQLYSIVPHPTGTGLVFDVTLAIVNPTGFAYPVPALNMDVAMDGTPIGTITNNAWQYIAPNGISYISGYLQSDSSQLALAVAGAWQSFGAITLSGHLHVGGQDVPVSFEL